MGSTYHSPITIESLTYLVLRGTFWYSSRRVRYQTRLIVTWMTLSAVVNPVSIESRASPRMQSPSTRHLRLTRWLRRRGRASCSRVVLRVGARRPEQFRVAHRAHGAVVGDARLVDGELAEKRGFDRNKWFNNVEVVASEGIGRKTVQYVSNINKYYLAYELLLEQQQQRDKAKGNH